MPGSSRWPRGGTAEQLRILEKAPTLPCPAHERSGCSWLVHCLLPKFLSRKSPSLQPEEFWWRGEC